MRAKAWFAGFSFVVLGCSLGEMVFALGRFESDYAWMTLTRPQSWVLGSALALTWCTAQALWWSWGHGLGLKRGWNLGLMSLLPWSWAWAWPLAAAKALPPPHQGPWRGVQFLAALCGVATVLLALGLGWRAWARSRACGRAGAGARAGRLAAGAWLAFLIIGTWAFSWHSTGDDPHYLLMAHSQAYDGDLDLKNNYRQGDWRAWHMRDLPPQYSELKGHLYTEHKAGISAVLVPAYRLLGPSGALWTVALMAALGVGLLALWLSAQGFTAQDQVLGAWLLASSSAWLLHANLILPELPLGLLILVLLAAPSKVLGRGSWSLALSALAWVSVRAYPLAAGLWCLRAWQGRKKLSPALWGELALPVISFALALALNRAQFGSFDPAAAYGSRQLGLGQLFQPGQALLHLGGLLLDQEVGFFFFVPLGFLALPGLFAWWHQGPMPKRELILVAALYVGVIAQYFEWHGSMAPARYLVCLTPLVVVAVLWARRAGLDGRLFAWLAAGNAFAAWFLAALPLLCYADLNGVNRLLRLALGSKGAFLTRFLPSFIVSRPSSVAWLVALAVLSFWLIRQTLLRLSASVRR